MDGEAKREGERGKGGGDDSIGGVETGKDRGVLGVDGERQFVQDLVDGGSG